MRESNNSLNEGIESSLKEFDLTLNNLQLKYNISIDNSV